VKSFKLFDDFLVTKGNFQAKFFALCSETCYAFLQSNFYQS